MKKLFSILMAAFVLFTGAAIIPVHAATPSGSLTLVIENVKGRDGKLIVNVYDSEKSFAGPKPVAHSECKIDGDTVTVVFNKLTYGTYGFMVVHDKNSNGRMDIDPETNMPTEGFAFSNNIVGPPNWDASKFTIQDKNTDMEAQLIYLRN